MFKVIFCIEYFIGELRYEFMVLIYKTVIVFEPFGNIEGWINALLELLDLQIYLQRFILNTAVVSIDEYIISRLQKAHQI